MILRLLLKRGLEEVIDENFVFVKYFQDLFIAFKGNTLALQL